MKQMGFADAWVALVMACVSSVLYYFRVNGDTKGYLIPSRGLRHSDPFSPYLILLCVEGLLALISTKERDGLFYGIRLAKSALCLHHLLFTDDNFFFARATVDDCEVVQLVLDVYSQGSAQAINFHKSSVAFNANVAPHFQDQLASFLKV